MGPARSSRAAPFHRFARPDREPGKFVSEVAQFEAQAVRESDGVLQGVRQVVEQGGHRLGSLQVAFRIGGEASARLLERGVVAQTGEDIDHPPPFRGCVQDAVGGEQRKTKRAGEIDPDGVEAVSPGRKCRWISTWTFPSPKIPRSRWSIAAVGAVSPRAWDGVRASGPSSSPVSATRPSANSGSSSQRTFALSLRGAQMSPREQLAEVVVSGAVLDEHGENGTILHVQFRPKMGRTPLSSAVLLNRGARKLPSGRRGRGRTVRIPRPPRPSCPGNEPPLQEAEGASGVEFDVGRGHGGSVVSHWSLGGVVGISRRGRRGSIRRCGG